MNRKLLALFAFMVMPLATLVVTLVVTTSGYCNEQKSLVIMIDGLRADTCCGASTPHLDSLRAGTWAEHYKGIWSFEGHAVHDAKPSSTPNHVSIATGVFAEKHTVLNNGFKDADNYAAFPTYISRLEKMNPSLHTAFFYNWGEDYWMPQKAKTPYDYTRTFGFSNKLDIHEVDEVVAMLDGTSKDETASSGDFVIQKPWISGNWKAGTDPDAILLYLEGVDPVGHGTNFSVFNDHYFALTSVYDAWVGRLLKTIKSRPTFDTEDWQIVVVSDHGGIRRTHGVVGCNNCYSIPLIVSFKAGSITDRTLAKISGGKFESPVRSGQIVGQASTADPAAYALLHMTGSVPKELDGRVRPVAPVAPNRLSQGMICYHSFDATLDSLVAHGKVRAGVPGGKVNGCLTLADLDSWLRFAKADQNDLTASGNFTFTLWVKTDDREHAFLPVLGNKNGENGMNRGFQLFANNGRDKSGKPVNSVEWSIGDDKTCYCLKELELVYGQWNFIAVTVNRQGSAFLYVGHENGRLGFITADVRTLGATDSGLDWNLGQDGRGTGHDAVTKQRSGFPGAIDELAQWNRALSIGEIQEVFRRGLDRKPLR